MPSEIDGHDLFGKAFDPKQSMEHKMVPSPFVSSVGSSFFSKDIRDRQIGFWKQEPVPDQHDIGNGGRSGVVSSTQFESFGLVGSKLLECLEMSKTHSLVDQKIKPNFEKHIIGPDRSAMLAATSWRTPDQNLGARLNFSVRSASWFAEANKDADRSHYENGLFSSSFSEVFDKKLRLSTPGFAFPHSIDGTSNLEDDENFESLKEIEARTIGNLLPDDDDLFSGVTDGIDGGTRISSGDDMEDYDFFSSVGGFELESDNGLSCNGTMEGSDHLGRIPNVQLSNSLYAGEHPFGEHPSRTLFVRNINSNVEDAELRALFEKYGDIRVLYTACKHRGFVMISYYDIRAARNAMRALQNKPLRNRKLDIHFSIPKDNPSEKDLNQGTLVVFNLDSSVSNDDLRQIFGDYGEIKEIRETPHKRHHKFIEFYDVRAADAALKALNRSDIAGKKIKLEPSRPGGARRLMQHLSNESELEEGGSLHQLAGCLTSSPPSCCIVQSSSIPTNCADTGASLGLNSSNRPPLSPFLDAMIPGISSARAPTSGLSPPIGVASIGNHVCRSSLGESNRPFGQVTTGLQSIPAFHPHSLPEFSCTSNNFVYNSPGAIRSLTTNNNVRYTEEIDARQMQRFGPDGFHSHSFDINEGVHGFTGNGSCPLHGHHLMLGTPNSYSQVPNPMGWSNSPSLVNGIHNQFHGFPRVQAHLMHPHHVGSAPVVDPSVWERRHPFLVDGNEVMSFLPGSIGSMGFAGSPGLHPMEFAPPAMFSHVAGNGLDASLSASKVGGPSPQHRCHMFSSRSGLISAPATFDGVNERGRGRRTDSNNQMDNKKQYELDLARISRGEDSRTTLMIKNIPNKYTSKMLLAAIDENHKGTYDFIYLPIDFKNKCNVGYAFINMVNSQQIIPFYEAFNGKKWEKFNSEKVASLAYARIQGKSALIAHFQNSSLMNEDKRCRPILFHSDGPNAGDQEPFPMGVNIRARAGKNRSTGNEENHHCSLSMSILGEDSSNGTDSSSGSAKDGE